MAISTEFKKLVEKRDLSAIRVYLSNYLLLDKTFNSFDESLRYAEQHSLDIYQEHDADYPNGKIITDRSKWTEEYMDSQFVVSFSNFSRERIKHLKDLVSYLYKDSGTKASSNLKRERISEEEIAEDDETHTKSERTKHFAATRKLLRDLVHDLWELLKSLGSRDFSVIKSKWQTLCRNAAANARRTAIGKKLVSILSKRVDSTEEARDQLNEIRKETDNVTKAGKLTEACYLYEEYQTNTSTAYQENQPESKTPFVHRAEYNFYDKNLMELKKLPSDEEQDSVTEPS